MKARGNAASAQVPAPRKRTRRSPEQARKLILEAAEALFVEGGSKAVSVRSVAERVGLTDMGVNHHFGSREQLLEALLEYAAGRLRRELAALTTRWQREGAQLATLVDVLARFYQAGHTQLALALYQAGWRYRGSALLEPVVEALHAERVRRFGKRADLDDVRLAVSALHQALALDPAFGAAFRRSAGLRGRDAGDPAAQRRWWLETLALRLGLPR